MPRYRFPIYSSTAAVVADTEGAEFPDDYTARLYGERVIADLKRDEPDNYFGWTMEIKDGERLVASIPFYKPN